MKKAGRPIYQIDYEKLEAMCKIHCTEAECAAILGIDRDTLTAALRRDGYDDFSAYFKKASAGGKMSLRRRQFKAAMDGSVPMLIWLGKNWLDQRETPSEQDMNAADKINSILSDFSDRLPN